MRKARSRALTCARSGAAFGRRAFVTKTRRHFGLSRQSRGQCLQIRSKHPGYAHVLRCLEQLYEGAGRPGPHLIQSSTTTPGTRANSDMLLVTTIKRLATAMAAIIKSRSPMGWPLAAKWARAWA